jgi:exodeoxyribonuclease-5
MKTITFADFSPDQQQALDQINAWRARSPCLAPQWRALAGYAGCGKTTIIAHLARTWPDVAVVTLCGKAVDVLRKKGVTQAQTLHSLIYTTEQMPNGKPRFYRRSCLPDVRTIIVDEASMINTDLVDDVLSFGLPVLFVGDHGQLQPIGTDPGIMKDPHFRLETIHRQAAGNPILRLATAFREGRSAPSVWRDSQGRLHITSRNEFHRLVRHDVQVICGYRKTRQEGNYSLRKSLGIGNRLVAEGEKLICLMNNKTYGIFNGQVFVVVQVGYQGAETINLELAVDEKTVIQVPCLIEQFGKKDTIDNHRSPKVALMDYAYCLTAHKSQGSEWDEVVALEQIDSRWDAKRWRYTVATRAKERLTYCA